MRIIKILFCSLSLILFLDCFLPGEKVIITLPPPNFYLTTQVFPLPQIQPPQSIQKTDNPDELFNIASQLVEEKKYDFALFAVYKIIYNKSPHNPQAFYELARIYAMKGDFQMAIRCLMTALSFGYDDIESIFSDPHLSSLAEHSPLKEIINFFQKIQEEK